MRQVLDTVRTYVLLRKLLAAAHRSRDRWADVQGRLLRAAVLHAYENVPFYHRLWDTTGFDARSLRDIEGLQRAPIVTRSMIEKMRCPEDLIASGTDSSKCSFLETTGSENSPLCIWKGPHEDRVRRASGLRIWLEHGFRWRYKTVDFQRTAGPPHLLQKLGISRKTYILRDLPVPEQLARFLSEEAEVVVGTATALRRICLAIQRNGLSVPRPCIVFCAGEYPDPQTRRIVSRVLSVDPVGIYGQSEVGYVAWQCEHRSDFHVNADLFLVEVLKKGSPVRPGQVGSIVITDLLARTMPFIRYDAGDLAIPSDTPCPCGRSLPTLASVEGRAAASILLPDGHWVTERTILDSMADLLPLASYRLVQEDLKSVRLELARDAHAKTEPSGIRGSQLVLEKAAVARLHRLLSGLAIVVQHTEPWESDSSWKTRTIVSALPVGGRL